MQKRPSQSRPKVPTKPSRVPSFASVGSRPPAPPAVLPTAAAANGGPGLDAAPAGPADANGGSLPAATGTDGLATSASVVSVGVTDTDKQRRPVQPLGPVPHGAAAGKKPRGRPPGTAKSGKRGLAKGRRVRVGMAGGRGRSSGGVASPDNSQDSVPVADGGEMADGVLPSASAGVVLPASTEVDATMAAGVLEHANGVLTPEANRPGGAG